MDVRGHRLVAALIFLGGCGGAAVAANRLMTEPPGSARVRSDLAGRWVGTRVVAAPGVAAEGAGALNTTVEFAGREARFQHLIDTPAGAGVINFEPGAGPLVRFDAKLDAGWLRGALRLDGDRLTLCTNALKPSERLGVPTRSWPGTLEPSAGRFVYEFRRAD